MMTKIIVFAIKALHNKQLVYTAFEQLKKDMKRYVK